MSGNRWARVRRILWRVSGAAVMVAVAVAIWTAMRGQDWSEAAAFADAEHLPLIAVSGAVNVVGLGLAMLSWHALADGGRSRVALPEAAKIYFAGMLVKYLPGRLWTLLVNLRMGAGAGIPASRMTGVYFLNIVVMVATGMLVGLLAARTAFGDRWAWVAAASLPALVLFARPQLVEVAMRLVCRLFRRSPVELDYGPGSIRRALGLQTGSWIVGGHHLWALVVAAGADPLESYALCVGLFGLATVVGALVLIVPDGLGVREGILTATLTLVVPLPMAAAVAITSRVVATVCELLAALAVYLWAARSAASSSASAYDSKVDSME
ncbi:lysylphosphatidylglycerol synthase domain-containing protein [Glycomyces xiaoerkulensis]|uniref:lysylphosphatidylglycerol synthase domain-containing protein n=1 Tax=Glycomyces xiaoerkulensis TaxID=2038139 RepID=UPI001300102D|nr:lysylphosphatidylglycerol synthase domain-containing protein [Glycomyces xiaoerkulensis]